MTTTKKRGPGRPKLPKGERQISCTFYLHPKTKAALRFLAETKNVSMAKKLTELIDDALAVELRCKYPRHFKMVSPL